MGVIKECGRTCIPLSRPGRRDDGGGIALRLRPRDIRLQLLGPLSLLVILFCFFLSFFGQPKFSTKHPLHSLGALLTFP